MPMPLDLRLLRQAQAARNYVALSAVLQAFAAALVVAQAVLVATLVAEAVTAGNVPQDRATLLLVWLFGIGVCRAAVAWAQERYALRAAANSIAQIRRELLRSAVRLGPRWAAGAGRTETGVLATEGLSAIEPYLVRFVPSVLATALVTPVELAALLRLDWVTFLICLVTVPLVPVFLWLVGVLTANRSQRRLVLTQRLGAQVLDLLEGLPTLTAFGRQFGPGARVRELGEAARRATMGTLRIAFLSSLVLELLTTLSVAVVAVSVGLRLVEGQMSLRAGLAVIMLAPEVYWPLRQVGAAFHASTDGLAATAAAYAVIDHAPPPPPAVTEQPAAAGLVVGVRFEQVSVAAGDRRRMAPAGLDAQIAIGPVEPGAGRIVALVGASGVGKSTAINLLLGLMHPDAGRVLLEVAREGAPQNRTGEPESMLAAVDLADLGDLDWWWSQLVWVPQRPTIPPGRLIDCVTADLRQMRADPATPTVSEAAALTGLDLAVASLPTGWNTRVGLGGAGLSLGQRQRLALTSALLAAPHRRLIILDEPTAHLDATSEQDLLRVLQAWRAQGRTVLVVAHRAPLVALADQVIEVRDGGV